MNGTLFYNARKEWDFPVQLLARREIFIDFSLHFNSLCMSVSTK